MIALVILVLVALFSIYGNRWQLHLAVTVAMNLFYLYFWITVLFPVPVFYSGYYLIFLVLYMIPVTVLLHIIAFIYGRLIKEKKILKINAIGFILSIIQITVSLFEVYL